ncbi:MAG: iron dependent repressor, metal binding and dimerization domain protein [Desulfobacterales bacterium]|nr:iron dependent repressor, metal binding and dimerization domain protein [Desulfobacterales bacterium]
MAFFVLKRGKFSGQSAIPQIKFLTNILKIRDDTADEEACKMEHTLSEATLDSLTDFMVFIQECPRAGESWLQNFEEYRVQGYKPEKCKSRSGEFACELKERIDHRDSDEGGGSGK